MSKIVCFGEVLLRLSAPGKELLLQTPALHTHVGGAEANVAVGLSRLGHAVSMVSAVPNNPLGQACAGELRRHGVNTDWIRFRDGRMGLYFLTHGAGHRPAEVLYDRAGSAFATSPPQMFDWSEILHGAHWLHVSGITPAVSPAGAASALAAVQAARSAGVHVSYDCNFRSRLWGERAAEAPGLLRELCTYATLIFGDDRDIAFMLGFTAPDATPGERRALAAREAFRNFSNLRWIAYTQRTRDSVDVQQIAGTLHDSQSVVSTLAYPLHGIVDRIGAGDAFAAGILHGLLTGMDAQATVNFGTAAACLKHSIPGDLGLFSIGDVELFLSEARTDVRR